MDASRAAFSRIAAAAGGRWAISREEYVVGAPLGVVAILVSVVQPGASARDLGVASAVALVSVLAIGLWAVVADRFLFPHRAVSPMSLPQIACGQIAVTCLIWGGTTVGIALVDAPDPLGAGPRFATTFLLVAWLGISASVLLDGRERFQQHRAEAIDTAVQYEVARMQGSEVLAAARERLQGRVASRMGAARAAFDERVSEVDGDRDWHGVSTTLRRAADDVVRPLSGELWRSASQAYPRVTLRSVIANVVRAQPFRPMAVILLYLVVSGLARVRELGIRDGGTRVSIVVAFIAVAMNAANKAMSKWPSSHGVIFVATVCCFQVFDIADGLTQPASSAPPYSVTQAVLDVLGSLAIIFVTSGVGSVRLTRAKMMATFHTDLDQRRIQMLAQNREVGEVARAIAAELHGSVQSRLLSCAAAIDTATADNDIVALTAALHEARLVLDRPLASTEPVDRSLAEAVAAKCDLWSGLCDVDIRLTDDVGGVRGQVAADFGAIVEEALTNAVRHGKATHVVVTGMRDEFGVHGTVSDNGVGHGGGTPNVGSSLFEMLTDGRFAVADDREGTGVLVTFTVRQVQLSGPSTP